LVIDTKTAKLGDTALENLIAHSTIETEIVHLVGREAHHRESGPAHPPAVAIVTSLAGLRGAVPEPQTGFGTVIDPASGKEETYGGDVIGAVVGRGAQPAGALLPGEAHRDVARGDIHPRNATIEPSALAPRGETMMPAIHGKPCGRSI